MSGRQRSAGKIGGVAKARPVKVLRPDGDVAASRGCSHRCRHYPVPVVYGGRRPVAEDAPGKGHTAAGVSAAAVAIRGARVLSHSGVSLLLDNGAGIEEVADLLGDDPPNALPPLSTQGPAHCRSDDSHGSRAVGHGGGSVRDLTKSPPTARHHFRSRTQRKRRQFAGVHGPGQRREIPI